MTDSLKRAVFQHDLWTIFDWVVGNAHHDHEAARQALASRLARVIRRVALTNDQIGGLPDNYAAAVRSHVFLDQNDPSSVDRAFLPRDLFDANGSWTYITGGRAASGTDPLTLQHANEASRSNFSVLLRLPGGRGPTERYLQQLWDFPQPYVADPSFSLDKNRERRAMLNPALPQLPPGTHVALVRHMLLIDDHGLVVPSNLAESIQLRVFHGPRRRARPEQQILTDDQDFFEFRLRRRQLFDGQSGGLHAVSRGEEGFITFSAMGMDEFERTTGAVRRHGAPILEGCVNCHAELGILSVRSVRQLLKPHSLFEHRDNGNRFDGAAWKIRRSDWALLEGFWRSSPR